MMIASQEIAQFHKEYAYHVKIVHHVERMRGVLWRDGAKFLKQRTSLDKKNRKKNWKRVRKLMKKI